MATSIRQSHCEQQLLVNYLLVEPWGKALCGERQSRHQQLEITLQLCGEIFELLSLMSG